MVHFIGAGPGDPELLTIKGKRLIDSADVIIYAGSLVNEKVLADCKEGAQVYNSAYMTLPEVIGVMKEAEARGQSVARVHTGDPSIYGAIREQMDALDELGISYEVIPGVSSFLAAAASMKKEYTLPGVSQTVILSRLEGRTPVPERESIRSLAAQLLLLFQERFDAVQPKGSDTVKIPGAVALLLRDFLCRPIADLLPNFLCRPFAVLSA